MKLDASFWNERYLSNQIGWDVGIITPPIQHYLDQLRDKSIRLLIPGAGNAYEAEYAWKSGFVHTFVLDWSAEALQNFQLRCPEFPIKQLIQADFFAAQGTFDLIIEQTFFCAIHPNIRAQYVQKMHELLSPDGKLVGVLFDAPMYDSRPPFGGSIAEYQRLLSDYFILQTLEPCYNSIAPRRGTECFVIAQRKIFL